MSKKDFENDQVEVGTEAEKMLKAEGHDPLAEAEIESPARMMVNSFFSNKIGVTGLVAFIAIFILVFGGSLLMPYDPYYSQPVLDNLSPGAGYMRYPSELESEGVKDIQVGTTFGVGLSEEGNVYTWGHEVADNIEAPEEFDQYQGSYEHILVGDKHIIAVTDDYEAVGWGFDNFSQTSFPQDVLELAKEEGIKKLVGSDMYSVLLTEEGTVKVWGSTLSTGLNMISSDYDKNVVDVLPSTTNMLALLKDGRLVVLGQRGTEIDTAMPEELKDGSVNVVQIGRMRYSGIAIDDQGEVYTWGAKSDQMTPLPEFDGEVVKLQSGREHVVALTDQGSVYSWGIDNYGTTEDAPEGTYTDVYTGYFNNYAKTEDGKLDTWGLDGFILGSDGHGRDMLTRIIHGGQLSLIVAFVSVFIQIVIGTIVGVVAGFYGGWVDNLLMRVAEVISSFPFYPLIITLSAILPVDITQNQRLLMIMIILGIINWPGLARLIRAEILSEREKDYITAARALGQTEIKTMLIHMVPNIVSIIIVRATIGFATNLLIEASLSFVGFGVRPPFPSWGNILTDSNSVTALESYWWRWIPTGLVVFATALSVNLIGDAINKAVDPRSQER